MAGAMTDLEIMQAERACERVIHLFAWCNDTGDNDGVADLFTTDGSFERPMAPGKPSVGREEIRRMLKARDPRFSRHLLSNIIVTVESATRATARSNVTFLSTTDVDAARPAAAEPHIYVGEYHDVLERTAAGWRIKSRLGRMALVANLAVTTG